MYYEILSICAPVLICAFIGYCWGKYSPDFNHQLISSLVFNIGVPCLIVSKLGAIKLTAGGLLSIATATVLILLLMAISASICSKIFNYSLKDFALPLIFPNSGNMGLPLVLFAFGDAGLSIALAVFSIIMVIHVTLGISYISNERTWRQLGASPIIYATAIAIAMILFGIELPTWAGNTVDLLGAFPIPLMLIMLGVSLAQLKAFEISQSLYISALRISLGFVCAFIITELFGIEGYQQGVFLLLFSMPVAVMNFLLAQQFDRNPKQVASCVVVSTLMSFLTLPWLIGFVIGL